MNVLVDHYISDEFYQCEHDSPLPELHVSHQFDPVTTEWAGAEVTVSLVKPGECATPEA